jgi:hypothetical protein
MPIRSAQIRPAIKANGLNAECNFQYKETTHIMTIDIKQHMNAQIFRSSKEQEAALALSSLSPTIKKVTKSTRRKPSGIQKPKKNKIKIPMHDIIRYLTLPQPTAAEKLGVSISTLKRRYYELNLGRWPINSSNGENGEEFKQEQLLSHQEKVKLENIQNDREVDAKIVDSLTMKVLQVAFKV